ncbi:MAG TPA: hypothetical protein PJ986_02740 [Gammaproteobacteria bacterium]|nr:hypothetical protein [Gammaproteobacteria bacterium]
MNAEIPKAEAKVYTLKVKLTGRRATDREWIRVIEMLDGYTLYDVHCTIQEVINFDDDHMYEFYIGTRWNKRVAEIGEGATPEDPGSYDDIALSTIFPLEKGQKLYYWFDFGHGWMFEITCTSVAGVLNKRARYPRVIAKSGRNPRQYSF